MTATYKRDSYSTNEIGNFERKIIETIDTDDLVNDSGEDWTEEMLRSYILNVCPTATEIEIN